MGSLSYRDIALSLLTEKSVPVKHEDTRTDDEILQAMLNPPPVTSEKNVWTFWDGGMTTVRPWSKRNVVGWVRLLGPEWTVRVLDSVDGSSANFNNFVDPEYLPDYVNQRDFSGRSSKQHASDAIRLQAIFQHGGVWMDIGIMLFQHLDQICWNQLLDPTLRFEVSLSSADPSLKTGVAENFFIAARKGNGFIRRWRDVFLQVFKGRSNCEGTHAHPLFLHLVEDGNLPDHFRNAPAAKLDYFVAYLAYERVRLLDDPEDGFNGPNYCKNRVLLLEYREFASAAMLTEDDGRRQFDLLSTPYTQDSQLPAYQEAQKFCEYMLSETIMMKLYHFKDEGRVPTLADWWDKAENHDADYRQGTFAEMMRYISAHYTPLRTPKHVKFPPVTERVLMAGLLEYDED